MKLTRIQKDAIRAYYRHYYKLRFRKDGTVEAQKFAGEAYGILYSPADTKRHLETMDLWKKEVDNSQD